jgi:hypothetical protein
MPGVNRSLSKPGDLQSSTTVLLSSSFKATDEDMNKTMFSTLHCLFRIQCCRRHVVDCAVERQRADPATLCRPPSITRDSKSSESVEFPQLCDVLLATQ